MNKNIIITIVVIAVVVISGYFLFSTNQKPITTTINQESNQNQQQNETNTAESPQNNEQIQTGKNYEVIYSDSGYSPSKITIKLGDTVTFKNQSSFGMWTSSAMHPTHIIYSGTSLSEHCPDAQNITFDECASAQPGESWSFTFNKVGTWRYHNHVQSSDFGTVVVE